jgi:hypothetical protein
MIKKSELDYFGRRLSVEVGRMANQADGAALVQYGETVVLATAVAQSEPKPDLDFFPLTVDYVEKTFAAGKIPGGFFKREGRPSEKEVLTSRLIDRAIRPLFANGLPCRRCGGDDRDGRGAGAVIHPVPRSDGGGPRGEDPRVLGDQPDPERSWVK